MVSERVALTYLFSSWIEEFKPDLGLLTDDIRGT